MVLSFILRINLIIITFYSLAGYNLLFSQDTIPSNELNFTLFDSLSKLDIDHVLILMDLDSINDIKLTANDIPAHFMLKTKDGQSKLHLESKISVRGKYRRQRCDFPPLKLNFKKGDLKSMGLHKTDDFKLVTHCLNSKDAEKYLFKEYLIYKMYNKLTSKSFEVLLFPIVYKDIDSKLEIKSWAFLIENDKNMAKRLNGKLCECLGTEVHEIDAFNYEQLAMLQYMIGNRDMTVKSLHNIKLVKRKNGPMIPVGFDFDFSLFVKAPYAFPNLEDNRVVKRVYLGYEQNKKHMEGVLSRFLSNKDYFIDYISDFKLLSAMERRECINYLKAFYKDLEKREYNIEYIMD
jgi:hypothetical protein